MIRTMRMLLRDNRILNRVFYRPLRWIALHVLKVKQFQIRRFGYEAVALIDDAAGKVGMPYYAYGGTLLGFIRDGDFISHDLDLDFAMMPDNGKVAAFYNELVKLGFDFERYILLDGKLQEFSVRYKEISIDFFARHYSDESRCNFHVLSGKVGNYYRAFIFPVPSKLVPYKIHGVKTVIPENYDEILTASYGDWHVVVKNWDDKMSPRFEKDFAVHDIVEERECSAWIDWLRCNRA